MTDLLTNHPEDLPIPNQTGGKFSWVDFLFLAVLIVVFVIPRGIALGRFVTADEPTWGKRSAGFYYALSNGDFKNTFQDPHPGVTTMWAGAIAYMVMFPEYREVGQTALGDTKLLQIFQKHGPNPLELMAVARLNVLLIMTALAAVSFLFMRRLFGRSLAILGFLFIAFDPLFLAHARFLHTNGLLSSLMFLSVLAFLDYLRTWKFYSLMISGIAAGLAFITITPGFLLIPSMFVLALLNLLIPAANGRDLKLKNWWKSLILPLVLWGLVSLITIFIVWPSMWVRPVGSILDIFQYTSSVTGGETEGAQFTDVFQIMSDRGIGYLTFYPRYFLWRTTPLVLIGLILAIPPLARRKAALLLGAGVRRNLLLLLVYAAVYTVFMTLGAKKADRYFLPVHLPLDLAAAAGWLALANWLGQKIPSLRRYAAPYLLLAVVVGLQAFGTLREAPYYLTYYNPLLGGIQKAQDAMWIGWGEGLNEAALYLKEKPGFCDQRIISWYPLAYNWYSISFGCDAQPVEFRSDTTLDDYLTNYDYALIYINQRQRDFPPQLLQYLAGKQPEHVIHIDGVDYVRIYRLGQEEPGS